MSIYFSLHQHPQLARGAGGLALLVVVHGDQGQGGCFVQLADLGQPLHQLVVGVGVVVPLPGLVVLPPLVVVGNEIRKNRSS